MEQNESPPPGGKANRTVVKKFRVTPAEEKAILKKATQANLEFSEYCRRAALEKVIVERILGEARVKIIGVSNNLNQLTRLANADRLPGVGIEQLNEVLALILETLR